MMVDRNGVATRRVALVLVAGALALGFTACGDSDDGNGDASAAAQTDSQQIERAYATLVNAFYEDLPEEGCAVMTKKAQKGFGAMGFGKDVDCLTRFEELVKRNTLGRPGDAKPSIVKLNVDGNKAVAVVKTPRSLRYKVPFAKEGGDWKVDGGF